MNLYKIWTETLVFNSRLRRKEFFFLLLAMVVVGAISEFVLLFLFSALDSSFNAIGFGNVFGLIFTIPIISAQIRRLHDSGHRGWWMLVPFVGNVFTFLKSVDEDRDWSWQNKKIRQFFQRKKR